MAAFIELTQRRRAWHGRISTEHGDRPRQMSRVIGQTANILQFLGPRHGLAPMAEAWEAHNRWIDQQAEQHGRIGYRGMDEQEAAAARALAGPADDDQPG